MGKLKASTVKAIIFDMGGTLKKPFMKNASIRPGIDRVMEILGLEGNADDYEKKIQERYYEYRKWTRETLTELSERDIWTKWLLPEEQKGKVAHYAVELNSVFKEALGISELRTDAVSVVKELHNRGYKLGIVSNTFSSTSTPLILEKYGLKEFFNTVILSSGFGRRKPDPSMLLKAVTDLNVLSGEAAYVGDKIDRDIISAKKAGFAVSIYIRNPGKPEIDPEYPDLKPDFTITELSELLSIFKS